MTWPSNRTCAEPVQFEVWASDPKRSRRGGNATRACDDLLFLERLGDDLRDVVDRRADRVRIDCLAEPRPHQLVIGEREDFRLDSHDRLGAQVSWVVRSRPCRPPVSVVRRWRGHELGLLSDEPERDHAVVSAGHELGLRAVAILEFVIAQHRVGRDSPYAEVSELLSHRVLHRPPDRFIARDVDRHDVAQVARGQVGRLPRLLDRGRATTSREPHGDRDAKQQRRNSPLIEIVHRNTLLIVVPSPPARSMQPRSYGF